MFALAFSLCVSILSHCSGYDVACLFLKGRHIHVALLYAAPSSTASTERWRQWWELAMRQKESCGPTDGNVLWSGSQQLRATTPATAHLAVKAVYKDSAPPWGRERGRLDCASADIWVVETAASHLREAAEDDARWKNPMFDLVVDDGFDWKERRQTCFTWYKKKSNFI